VLNMAILFFGAGAMVLGRLSDIVGRRRLLLAALAVVAVASVGCALAPSVGALIGFRALEGIGMSGTYAASFPIVSNAFPPERRSVGLGMWAAGFMFGNVVGGPVAGWFSQSLSWRWLFWLNLPLLAAGLALTLFAVEESRDESASSRPPSPSSACSSACSRPTNWVGAHLRLPVPLVPRPCSWLPSSSWSPGDRCP
jgi:MFS family permease